MKKMKKWKIVALCVILACLAVAASGTLAYYTAQGTAHNVITTGGVDIELNEWSKTDDGLIAWKEVEGKIARNVMPGTEISKIAEVENTGASAAWIRVSVEKVIKLAEGIEAEINPDLVTLDINSAYWTEKDGYYYYKDAVEPEEKTVPVFTTVSFDTSMGNEYQGCTVDIEVEAEAVQVANNGASALTAAGWPAKPHE